MNTSDVNNRSANIGPPPRTPPIAELYNLSEPPLCTRLERIRKTPRMMTKAPPKVPKARDRWLQGRSVMETPTEACIVSPTNRYRKLDPPHNSDDKKSYIDQIFVRECELGQGSFGTVYRAKELATGKLYAIKCAQEPYRNNRNRREMHREVMMHERVPKHENLVEFIQAWEEHDLLYIQIELCESSLEDHLHKYAPLPEWRVWDIFLDLGKAIHYLDVHNVIHADIKPANILVSFDGVCKLGDFGLMVDLNVDKIDETESYEGDAKYLAREVLNGGLTKKATIFSFGLSIFQIATDIYLPSCGDRWHEIRDMKIDPKFASHLTSELVSLVYRMMATDPSQRPDICEIINSPMLREHDRAYRNWNKQFYPVFRKLSYCPFATFPKVTGI